MFSLQKTISSNYTLLESDKNRSIFVTGNATVTIPATLSATWNCNLIIYPNVTLSFAITTPHVFLAGLDISPILAPTDRVATAHLSKVESSNTIILAR